MEQWITETMASLGYLGVGLMMFLENVFPPIPSEAIMPLAGFVAGRGELSLWGVILAGTIGAVLGQYPLYFAGRLLGEHRVRAWADRHGRWVMLRGADIDRASDWLRRRGPWAVCLCRLVPGVRSLISIPAGIARINLVVFTLYSALGITAWGAALAAAGYLLGEHYEKVQSYAGPAGKWVFALVGLVMIGWIGGRYWKRTRLKRQARRAGSPGGDGQTASGQVSGTLVNRES